ncbi:Parallel beta-helix repeat protein [Chthoniobacter flavus Ellin428]|uniref:Parallel beta-helix repeat protein n=1 Tax=Chthoniobacter flavus Ellin428 TaxID=497964 RepID=B4D818_9BACT|nr:Parallel beta-helix repeat protein [Chthoniobacter flavus Ellin428]
MMWRAFYSADRRRSIVLPALRSKVSKPIFSGLTLFAFGVAFGAPQHALRAEVSKPLDKQVEIQSPDSDAERAGRVTFGLEFYEHQIDESLDTLVPLATPQNGVLYFNPKLSLSDRLNPSVSIGFGYRHLLKARRSSSGETSLRSDYTNFDHHVNQFGVGAEVMSRWVDFRANYYLPEQNRRRINTNQTTSLSQKVTSSSQPLGPVTTSDTLGFAGHNVVETINGMNETLNTFHVTNSQTTHFWEQYEGAMRGVDSELGFLIPGLDKYAETRIFGGYYYYENPFGKNLSGFKGRLEVRALPAITLDAAYYQNKEIVGSNWYYGIRVSTPFDIGNIAHGKNPFAGFTEGFKPQHASDAERFADRLTENVIRNPHVATAQSKFIEVGQKTVAIDPPASVVTGTPFTKTIVLTLDGTPITVTHVDSAAAVAGDGTVEHPYMTLTLADSDAVKRAIVLLHAASTFNSQSITLAANQQLLGDSKNVTNSIKTDQLGTIKLPHIGNSAVLPTITNPGGTIVTVATNNTISGLNLTNAARGVAAPSGTTNLLVQNSTISNMTIAGLGLDTVPSTKTTIANITFTGNNQDVAINGSDTTIANVTSSGATHGSIDLISPSGTTTLSSVTVTGASDFALRSTNAAVGSTHNFASFTATGGAAGVDIEGGAGTFNFDSASALTSTGGASLLINGGSSNVNFGGNITQAMNAPAVAVLGGHTGTVQFSGGTVAASAGPGLQFDNANGTYQFLGTTNLTGGADLQILDNSAGAFTFGTHASIVNGSGQDILVDSSTASLTYSGSASTNSGALLQVNNHTTGTLQFDTGTLSATAGSSGLQFNNADGTYRFLGTTTLNGSTAGVSLTNGSDGTFAFDTATTITNPIGNAFFVDGGTSNITYSGNITANAGFALLVQNHSTGTINFNTGNINQTAGIGVQFLNDTGTYNLADTRVSNSVGTPLQVINSAAGTFNFGTVKLVDSAGTAVLLNNGGTVNLFAGTIDGAGGNGILSINTTLTATGLTLGGDHSRTISGIGVQEINNDGITRLVTISNDNIRSNGPGILTTDGGNGKLTLVLDGNTIETLAGGAPAMSITGSTLNSTIVKSMNGGTVVANGTGGGVVFNQVTFDASGSALSGTQVNAGTWNIGQGTGANQRVLNDGLDLKGTTGLLNFGTLNIDNNAGTGLLVDTKTLGTTFTLSGGGSGTIDTTGGTAVNLDPLTTNFTLGSVTSTNSPGAGVIVNGLTSGSTLTFGSTHVVNSAGSGIVVQNSNGANINFGTTTVNNPGDSGIDLSGAGGANVTFGTTLIVNPGASGINMSGATGTFVFGDTTINGTAAGQTAFNLNGGNADVTALSLNINGGGIGIDLRNTINGRTVSVTNGGTIQNVGVGVQLGGGTTGDFTQTADAFFTFDVTGGHNSTISGTVAIEARGLVSTASNVEGTYDFRNVTNILGAENFEPTIGTPFFVAASAHGTGDGSTPNNAAAYTAISGTPAGTFIILVNDGNTINLGASTITLQNNDHVDTFGNGRTFSAGSAPLNILLPGVAQFTDPFGHGAATITGTGTLFAAANGDLLQDFTMTLGGGTAISASGINGLDVTNLTINGTGSVFSLTNDTGSIDLTGNSVHVSGGQLLNVSGGNANITLAATLSLPGGTGSITESGGGGVSVTGTTGGSVTITGVTVTGATSTPLVFDNNKATFNITNSTFAASSGVTLLSVDTTVGGSTTTLAFNNTNVLTQSSGTIANIGAGARNIDLSAQNFTNSGTTAANVINVTGQTGGAISFGNVGITGYNNAAGTAVNLQGTGGTVSFGDLDVATAAGAGVNVGAVTFAPGATPTISTAGGPALVMNGTTISGGAATFTSVTASNAGAGNAAISLTNVIGSTTFSTVNLSGTAANGLNLNNAGTVAVLGGTINGTSGDAISSTNTALTATGLTIGASAAPLGNGITIVNSDGIARLVTLSNDTITARGDAIHTTDGGHAGELSLVLDNNTLQTLNGGTLSLSVTGSALNSTTINSLNGGTVIGNGVSGGLLFNQVTFNAVTGGPAQQVNAGNWNIGQGIAANQRVNGNGLDFEGPTGNLAFGTLTIFNNAGTGLIVNTKALGTTFSLSNTGGAIDTSNGTAMNLDPLTANLTFSGVKSVNSPTSGVILNTVGGSVALGNVTVTGATNVGLSVTNSNAAVTTGTLTVTNAATGLQFGDNTGGSFTASGLTNLTGITGTGINANGATGTYQFADLDINFIGASRGLDLRNSNVQFSTANLSITGDGTAGSIGLDLSGSTNPNGVNAATPNLLLATGVGQKATISNVATGVLLGDAANGSAGAYLKFGNQTPTSSGGSGSSISVIAGGTTIDTTNLISTSGFVQGRYEFTGVAFTGNASFQHSPNFFFVAANATGNHDGSTVNDRADAATLITDLNGNLLTNKTIVLINDGNVISLGNNTATLDALTNIDGFGNGNSVTAFSIPANVIVDAFTGTVSDPTGNGAATITANAGNNVITLTGTHSIENINITGGNFLIGGTTTGLTVQGVHLTNGGVGAISLTNSSGVVNITNNTISQGGGSLLTVNGGTAGITLSAGTGTIANTNGSGISIKNTTGGSVTLDHLSVTSANATPLTFDHNQATFNITNSTFSVGSPNVTLLNVDATGASTTSLVFDGSNTLANFNGAIAIIGAGARNIDLSAQGFSIGGSTAANVISVTGQTGGTISFGNINITGYNNAAGTAVNLQGTNGAVNFTTLSVTTSSGAGVNTGAITFGTGTGVNISSTGGPALTMNGTTVTGSGFGTVSATNTGAGNSGISITNVASAFTIGSVAISNTGAAGIVLSGDASVTITGGTINGTTGNGITITNSGFALQNLNIGGTATIAGDGIHITETDATNRSGLTITGVTIGGISAANKGISFANSGAGNDALDIESSNITAPGNSLDVIKSGAGNLNMAAVSDTLASTAGAGMNVDGSAGAGVLAVTTLQNITVTQAQAGGMLFHGVTFDADTTVAGIQTVSGGTTAIGNPGSPSAIHGDGLRLDGVLGSIAFTSLNIGNNIGTGLYIRDAAGKAGSFSFSNGGGVIFTTSGSAMDVDPVTFNATFSAVTSTGSTGNGITLNTVAGTSNLGTVTIQNAASTGFSLVGSSANVTLGSLTVTGTPNGLNLGNNTGTFEVTGNTSLTATTAGILATNATGTYKFDGTTTITAPTGISANGATGSWTFTGNTTINFTGANRGLDLRNTQFTVFQTGTIAITGDGTVGGIGLDLSGSKYTTGAQPVTAPANITLAHASGKTASIGNVGTGILLGNTTDGSAGAYLQYGNQTPLTSSGSGSNIAVISGGVTLDTTHLTSTTGFQQGRYEFTGVTFTGSASFQASPNFFFVAAGTTGTGDGSSVNNRASAATLLTDLGTNALANKTIVLINDGNVISLGNNTAQLDAGTNINGFGNGNTFTAFTVPVNVITDAINGTVSDPTGNGAATLTANAGNNVVTLTGTHSIQNVNLSGGNFLVAGSGFTGLTVQGVGLSGAGTGVFSFTNPTGTINITNNTINQSGGSLLVLNGGSANITFTAGTGSISNTGGSGINIKNTTGGIVTLIGLSVTGATATPLTFDHNQAAFAIVNSAFGVTAGTTLLDVDNGTGGSTNALVFGATDTLTQTSGEIAIIGTGARDIALSAQNFTNSGTTAANVINVTGQTGGTIAFGTVNITGYNNAAGTAVNLQGTAGTDSFVNLTVATTAGAGVNTGAITFAPGSSPSISTTGGPALVMNGTTISGGAATFSSVSASNAGAANAAINLTNVIGSTTFSTVNLSGTETNGIKLSGDGAISVLGGTINGGSSDAITSTNTALTVTGVTIGGTAAPAGNGITIVNNDGTARVVTLSNDTITAVGNGIATTDGAHAKELTLVLDGDTLQTTTLGKFALSVTGSVLNSTIVKSMNGGAVIGGANTGGVLFNQVTFDASGATLSGTQVNAGTWNIGQSTSVRVQGNALDFEGPTGNLTFTALNIFNNNGTGLLVNTKALGTTFTLGSASTAVDTTSGTAMNLDPLTANLTFSSVKSTGAVNGVVLNTVGGTVALGAVNVSTASGIGLEMINSSAAVTASSVTVNGAATGLQFGTNTGSFTVSGTTSLTGITGTGINANSANGTYSFQGTTTITFSGAGRGIDLQNSKVTQFSTGNLTLTGDGATAGSIGIDLSGSQYSGPQPVGTTSPNVSLATGAGQTAAISGVSTGIALGNAANGSAGAYLRYGNQTPGNSGSSIAVNSGGTTIDTSHLTSVNPSQQGRYEFTGVTFTGKSTFEAPNPNFIFVGSVAAGAANGADPNDRISLTTFMTNDNAAFLAGKTVIFVNDNGGAGLTLTSTLNLGAGTTIESFGNGASVIVPAGVQPVNVIGDNFHLSGGTFSDPTNGAATLKAAAGVNLITLDNGDTVQNINLTTGNNQIIGTNTAGFTMAGVNLTNAGASAISLTTPSGTITMTGGSISGAAGPSFFVSGGNAVISYNSTITNTAGHSVQVQGITGGSVTLSGAITDTGTGILVQNNTGGTITFSGASDSIHTGANQAVTLSTNTGAKIDFTGGGLSIQTTTATGFGASGGGTVGMSGAGNTITSTTGTALSLNGVTTDTGGFILQSVSANGAVNGIALNNLTGAAFDSVSVSGGTIQNTTGTAVSLTNLGSLNGGVILNNLTLSGASGIVGTNFGTLATANDSVSATAGAGLSLTTGIIVTNSSFSTLSSTGGTNGVLLSGVSGSLTASAGTITNESGAAWSVVGGTVSATYSGGITQANNAALVSITGGHASGTITFQTGTLSATSGTGLVFDNADGAYNFNGTTTLNGGNAAITIQNGSSGTFTFSAATSIGATTSPAAVAFNEVNSSANVTYHGSINQNNGFSAVAVSGETAGTTAFTGAITASTGAATAINLTSNTGATINFTGGGLSIQTTTATGFGASGGGTVGVTGTGNTINATSGTGLDVANTTIGASGLTFRSISSGAGANDGIILDTTGTSGGLTVTGTGTANSGGVITGKTGADGSTTTGIGIYLNSTQNVSLAWMDLESNQNYGIRGNSVTNFTLDHSTVGATGTNGTSLTADTDASGYFGEGSIRFYNLFGTNTISNSTVDKGFARSLAVSNDTGTLTNLTISNSTINNTLTKTAGALDALYFQTKGSSTTATLTVTNSTFSSHPQYAIDASADTGSTMHITITGSTFKNVNADIWGASNAVVINGNGTNTFVTFDIENSTFTQGNGTTAASTSFGRLITAGSVGGSGTFYGKIINNTFGVAGVQYSGGGVGADSIGLFMNGNAGTAGTMGSNHDSLFLVQGNTIQQYDQSGLQIGVTGGNAVVDATVIGNTIRDPNTDAPNPTPNAFAGIWAYAGGSGTDANTLNLLIGGTTAANKNILTGSDPNHIDDVFLGSGAGTSPSVINIYQGGSTSTTPAQVIIDDNTVPPAEAYGDDGLTTIHVIIAPPAGPPTPP